MQKEAGTLPRLLYIIDELIQLPLIIVVLICHVLLKEVPDPLRSYRVAELP